MSDDQAIYVFYDLPTDEGRNCGIKQLETYEEATNFMNNMLQLVPSIHVGDLAQYFRIITGEEHTFLLESVHLQLKVGDDVY